MENLLIVLVFIASIVYKIYSNYKEEMAKSAQRSKQQPNPLPYIPQVKTQQVENPFAKKSNTIQDIPEEVQRIITEKKEKSMTARKNNIDNMPNERVPVSFDLRQAIIQAAILERPYK